MCPRKLELKLSTMISDRTKQQKVNEAPAGVAFRIIPTSITAFRTTAACGTSTRFLFLNVYTMTRSRQGAGLNRGDARDRKQPKRRFSPPRRVSGFEPADPDGHKVDGSATLQMNFKCLHPLEGFSFCCFLGVFVKFFLCKCWVAF